jgi:hypothetical protein
MLAQSNQRSRASLDPRVTRRQASAGHDTRSRFGGEGAATTGVHDVADTCHLSRRAGSARWKGSAMHCDQTRPARSDLDRLSQHRAETKKRLQKGCVNESRLFLHASDAGHGMVRWNVMEGRPARLDSLMSASDVTHLAAAKRRGSKAQHRNACRLEYP